MTRKANFCGSCYANGIQNCLLGCPRILKPIEEEGKAITNVGAWSPIYCCHKPKTLIEFYDRLEKYQSMEKE